MSRENTTGETNMYGQGLRRIAVGALGTLAIFAIPGAAGAFAKTPNLDGETLAAPSAELHPEATGGEAYCGALQQGAVSFSATGTASGPYPGTFTETGHWDFDLINEQSFGATFRIVSGARVLTGIVSWEEGATGPEGGSLVNNWGGCNWSQSGGPYSTCETESFAGSCGGSAVAFISAEGLSQTFEHPTGKYHLTIIEGNEQVGYPGAEFEKPLVVRVTDGLGAPVGGAYVTFAGAKHNPTGGPVGPWTGSGWDGVASMPFIAGVTAGTYNVTAKSEKGAKALFTLTNAF